MQIDQDMDFLASSLTIQSDDNMLTLFIHVLLKYIDVLWFVFLIIFVPGARPLSEEEHLWQVLFHGYNPSARPVMNSSSTVSVAIQFSLMHIKELVRAVT